MNILFHSRFGADAHSGGVQHVTLQIASALKTMYQYRCFLSMESSAYQYDSEVFEDVLCLNGDTADASIKEFIEKHQIECIVVQGCYNTLFRLKKNIDDKDVKLVFCLHGEPGFEFKIYNAENCLYNIKYSKGQMRFKNILSLLLLHYFKHSVQKEVARNYNSVVETADKVVLLSEKNKENFIALIDDKSAKDKITYISNPLSYESVDVDLSRKEHRVLMVARFEEYTKKISLALKIWAVLEKKYDIGDWQLDIVGDGENAANYRAMAEELGLKNVSFQGYQKPEKYYERSSVYMMTSLCEGWPLSLTEAMQYACVPVLFDSFPAAGEIVKNGKNGFTVKYHNLTAFADRLYELMDNDTQRLELSRCALQSVQQWSVTRIAPNWAQLCN